MSQYLSQTLSQRMRMEQRLTPQLIQSMALLQKPLPELEAYIEEALESNAALEVDERSEGESESSRIAQNWQAEERDAEGRLGDHLRNVRCSGDCRAARSVVAGLRSRQR